MLVPNRSGIGQPDQNKLRGIIIIYILACEYIIDRCTTRGGAGFIVVIINYDEVSGR